MESKVPKPNAKQQGTQPQQFVTANGDVPSPTQTQPQEFVTASGDVPSPTQTQPHAARATVRESLAPRPTPPGVGESATFEIAAAALEPTGIALPKPAPPSPTSVVPTQPMPVSEPVEAALGVAKTQAAPNSYRVVDTGAPFESGTTIGGRYVIDNHISSGSFGAVYKASDRAIPNHTLAIKILHTPAESDEAKEKGLRELRLIASVAHPSVVQFKDYGWHEGRLWFAMPWYSGHTLYDRVGGDDLALREPLSRADARPIFERLAMGLAAMHAVGIHHHDIKPENVFLANVAGFWEGFPVLLDLGIAAAEGELPAGFTAEYAAPETANTALGVTGHRIGAAADVFSLALTLRNVLDPDLIADPEVPSIALLTARASQPAPTSQRRDLRYLKPYFNRWLSLDPEERPSPEQFAAELAVLTEPEERRQARMKTLRRAAPFVLLAAGALAFLGYQLSEQKEVVSEQRQVIAIKDEKLHEQMAEATRLRQSSQAQLAELDATKSKVGDKEAQLKRALSVAHDLDDQLTRSEQLRQTLSTRVSRLDADLKALRTELDGVAQTRDRLQGERDGLVSERDSLQQQRTALRAERDGLVSERDALRRERDSLLAQVADVDRARAALVEERDNLRRSIDTFVRDRDNVAAERDSLRRERDQATTEANRLRTQLDTVEDERNRLRSEVATLRERRASTSTTTDAPSTDTPSTDAPVAPGTPAVRERPIRRPTR